MISFRRLKSENHSKSNHLDDEGSVSWNAFELYRYVRNDIIYYKIQWKEEVL